MKVWEEPGVSVHLFIFVVLGLKLCFCINNGIPMKAEPTESPQAPLCPLPTQLDYFWTHCQVGFGLGHCLEGELEMGMACGGANRSSLCLLKQNLVSFSGMDRDLLGVYGATSMQVHHSLINLGVTITSGYLIGVEQLIDGWFLLLFLVLGTTWA